MTAIHDHFERGYAVADLTSIHSRLHRVGSEYGFMSDRNSLSLRAEHHACNSELPVLPMTGFNLMDDLSSPSAGLDFYAIFDAAPTPYLILTPALVIAAVNEAYLQVTERRREEIIGHCIFDAFPDNPNDPGANGVEKLRKSLERVLSYRVRDTMGVQRYDIPVGDPAEGRFEERYWSSINTPVFDAHGILTHIIHRVENVTELVQTRTLAELTKSKVAVQAQEIQVINAHLHKSKLEAREAARRAEAERQRLDAVLDVAPVGIFVVDSNGVLLQTNKANQRLWGNAQTRSQSIVDFSKWVGRWADGSPRHGKAIEPHEWPLSRSLRGEEVPYEIIELDSFDRAPVRHTVLASAVPIKDGQGEVTGSVVTVMDITDRVKAEHALRDASDRQTFQLALSDRIRPLADPDAIIEISSEMLAKYLNVSRVAYGEVSGPGESVLLKRGWACDQVELLDGAVLRLDDFGPLMAAVLRAGKVLAVSDILSDERSARYADAYAANGVRSVLAIPLMKAGQLRALLNIHHSSIRNWTEAEIALSQDMMDRAWSAVERARAEANLRLEHAQTRYIFDSMTEGFALLDHDWTVLQMNAAGLRISQRTESNVIGCTCWEVWPELKGTDTERLYHLVKQKNIAGTVELHHALPDGKKMWVEIRAYPALGGGLAFFFRDITKRKDAEEKIRHASLHDSLTGLPNRSMLFEYAGHLLPHNKRTSRRAALLFLDLDRFKSVNDTHGHETGDKMLKEVASRLSHALRTEDIVVRLGGDEFLILLQDINHVYDAAEVAKHIIGKINEPYRTGELTLSLSTSVGISIFPGDGQDIDTLISHADAAMYQAKQAGRNNFQFYSPEFAAGTRLQVVIEQQLRSALYTDAFHLYYQPVVDLKTLDIVSVEALLRWKNNDVGPDQFVPIAEATGIINSIGRWVLQEASRQHNTWLANGLPAIPIAVNVSVVEFRDRDFVSHFKRLVNEHGIDIRALQLELTETAVMDDIEHAIALLSELKALGVKILLDDFGTGHSSLAYLARLPLNKLKIDKSFISRLESDVASRAVTDAMLALGHTLNLDMVAEGVESTTELDYLQSRGCQQAQGYFFSKPMAGDAFQSWYRENRLKLQHVEH
jgi:diguanylate cyclase (GGDEF)-like protein/PAS domain S-box-containing protein